MKYWHEIGQVSYVLYKLCNLEAFQSGIKKIDQSLFTIVRLGRLRRVKLKSFFFRHRRHSKIGFTI